VTGDGTILLEHAAIHPGEGAPIGTGHVLVRDGKIAALGAGPYSGDEPDRRIDLSGCIVVPGFVNTHHHFFQTLTRAIPTVQRAGLLDWLFHMYPLWAGLDEEAVYWSALATSAELMLTGTTTAVDMAYLLPERDGELADAEVEAVREAGIRFHFLRGCMPTIESDLQQRLGPVMGADLDRLIDDPDRVFAGMDHAIRRFHDTSEGSMLRVDIGPTGVTYAMPDFMRRLADYAAEHGCGLHSHFHPRPDERRTAETEFGGSPVDLLERFGWLRDGTWFAHGTRLNDDEIRTFADNGVGLSHCPRCVMRLGMAVTRIAAMRAAGMKVGIGVDGGASNDSGSMLNEVRLALVLHRVDGERRGESSESWLAPEDALAMATADGAAILRRPEIGRLQPGLRADIAAFRIDRVGCAGAVVDPLGALLLADSGAYAALTMIDGRVRVRDGQLVDLDEGRIVENVNRCARRMIERAARSTGLDYGSIERGA